MRLLICNVPVLRYRNTVSGVFSCRKFNIVSSSFSQNLLGSTDTPCSTYTRFSYGKSCSSDTDFAWMTLFLGCTSRLRFNDFRFIISYLTSAICMVKNNFHAKCFLLSSKSLRMFRPVTLCVVRNLFLGRGSHLLRQYN